MARAPRETGGCDSGQSGFGAVGPAGARQDGSDTTRDVDGSDLSRALAIGCSFTHGDGVEGAEAWPAVVERSLSGHEVVNLGVGAYGLDQALLRLRRDGPELAPDKVWMPEAGEPVIARVKSMDWPIHGDLHLDPSEVSCAITGAEEPCDEVVEVS